MIDIIEHSIESILFFTTVDKYNDNFTNSKISIIDNNNDWDIFPSNKQI